MHVYAATCILEDCDGVIDPCVACLCLRIWGLLGDMACGAVASSVSIPEREIGTIQDSDCSWFKALRQPPEGPGHLKLGVTYPIC